MDAVLLIAFGGPTRREEVRPFLANVLRGRPIPTERIEEVVRHYEEIGPGAPRVEFLPTWHAHPLFIEAVADRVHLALAALAPEQRNGSELVFTAHSIPTEMAEASRYEEQIDAAARAVAERTGFSSYAIAYRSRSGNPREPWLEPDIGDLIRARAAAGTRRLVVVPIGFVCDHVEVLYDLDIEAKRIAGEKGIDLVRVQTVNDHPAFIRMMASLVRDHVRSASTDERSEA